MKTMAIAHIKDSVWTTKLAFMPLASMAVVFALFPLSGQAHAEEMTVKIDNFTFNPAELTVKPGTTVTWVNGDDTPHSVVEAGGKFHSKPLDTGEKFTMTFADAGEITYFCGIHPKMTGKIIIKP
jgi:plastocyanin